MELYEDTTNIMKESATSFFRLQVTKQVGGFVNTVFH